MNHIIKNLFSFLTIVFFCSIAYPQGLVQIIDSFSGVKANSDEISGWKGKSFLGHTEYSLVDFWGNIVVHARADGAASGLF